MTSGIIHHKEVSCYDVMKALDTELIGKYKENNRDFPNIFRISVLGQDFRHGTRGHWASEHQLICVTKQLHVTQYFISSFVMLQVSLQ